MSTSSKVLLGLLLTGLIGTALVFFTPLAFVIFPLKGYDSLEYPEGVNFMATQGEEFTTFSWYCQDCKDPGSFPLKVVAAGQEIDLAFLSSPDRLSAAGWNREKTGVDTFLYDSPGNLLRVRFDKTKLWNVEVHAKGDAATIAVLGKQIDLPATRATIIRTFGTPNVQK